MNNKSKIYKNSKFKHYLKKTDLTFFYHITNLNSKNWLKIEQELFNYNLKYYKIQNNITKNVLRSSIFSNYFSLLNGSICLINPKKHSNNSIDFKKLSKISDTMPFICLKLNKKIYSINQLKNITTLNYNKNVTVMNKTFKKLLKTPYYKLKTISK